MQTISWLQSKLTIGRSLTVGLLVLGALVAGFSLAPRHTDQALAETCANPPAQATLNYWPVTYSSPAEFCHDYPALDARIANGGSYSSSQADLQNGLTANEGDEIYVLSYIHNGAANNLGDTTTAKNVRIASQVPTTTGTDHVLTTTFRGDNTNTVNGSYTIHTAANMKLEVVANSGEMYNNKGAAPALRTGFNVTNGEYVIGDMQSCFEYSLFIRYKVKVVKVTPPVETNPTLTITKEVRNVTSNGAFQKSVNADQNNTVEYRIKVKNTGTGAANNTIVTDSIPTGITYVNNTVTVSTAFTGTMTNGGMNIGTLAPGAETTITYRATVSAASGTLVNTATAKADNVAQVTDTATVIVNNTPVLTNNAVCVANVVLSPSSPTSGQQFTGTITVKNTGTTTWAAGTYKLGSQSPQDNTNWGVNRVSLPSNVAPNGEATFTITATAPTAAGTYPFAWQMVQDGVGWFGPICQATITIVNNPVQNPNLTITKEVRNVTTNGSFQKSVQDAHKDTAVEYRIKVKNTGAGIANNVVVTDVVPSGITYQNNTFVVSSASTGAIYSGGLNLGNMAAGSEVTITYRATATVTTGTLVNTACAQASNNAKVCDTATVVVTDNTPTPIYTISIDKQVRNITSGAAFSNSVNATTGQEVEFRMVVTNTGNAALNNVRVDDALPSGLTASSTFNGVIGNLAVGQSQTVTIRATVDKNASISCIVNTAYAQGDNTTRVQDDASVCVSTVNGGNVVLNYSKKAFNDTKNVNAETVTASREDFITYTLTVSNSGTLAAENFIITDDLSGVLPFADMTDLGGGTVTGNVLTYPAVTVPVGGSVSKTFRVRVKYSLNSSLSYVIRNTYGNTVTVNVPAVPGTPIVVAPTTGSASTSAGIFAGLLTAGFVIFRNRRELYRLIFA